MIAPEDLSLVELRPTAPMSSYLGYDVTTKDDSINCQIFVDKKAVGFGNLGRITCHHLSEVSLHLGFSTGNIVICNDRTKIGQYSVINWS